MIRVAATRERKAHTSQAPPSLPPSLHLPVHHQPPPIVLIHRAAQIHPRAVQVPALIQESTHSLAQLAQLADRAVEATFAVFVFRV